MKYLTDVRAKRDWEENQYTRDLIRGLEGGKTARDK